MLQNTISNEIGALKDEIRENTVEEVKEALKSNIEAIQRTTKTIEKQTDIWTNIMKRKLRELEESKNTFFKYEGKKMYLFWGGMGCNIATLVLLICYLFVK